MGLTKIEWVDNVWNPITGCSPVSEGCRNCYAKRFAYRLKGRYGYSKDDPFKVTFHPDRLDDPLKWKKAKRIFVCSMGDLFHPDVLCEWIDQIWEIMAACRWHTFFVLTKRPENVDPLLYGINSDCVCREVGGGDYLKNVWFGVSVEDQKTADDRIPILLQISAAHRWLSVEPMLSSINLGKLSDPNISWVVLGSESGSRRRPAKLVWMRNIVEQCRAAGVPVFVKQIEINEKTSENMEEWSKDLRIREMPK